MATLIPAIGTSAFDSTGERRLAERLEQKLDADYLLWHNVPIGPKQTHPVDLAALYGVQTKRLNEQVKRNRDRLPTDFLFQLTADEKTEVVEHCDHLQTLKFSKALPLRLPSTEPPKRPIGFLTHEDKKTPKASRMTEGRKAP